MFYRCPFYHLYFVENIVEKQRVGREDKGCVVSSHVDTER